MADMDKFSRADDARARNWSYRDRLLRRMSLLRKEDKVFLEAYLRFDMPFRKLAELSGRDEKTIARRIRSLAGRLMGDEYIRVLEMKDCLSAEEMAIAYDYFLLGRSRRALGRLYHMGRARTERVIGKLEALARGGQDVPGQGGKKQSQVLEVGGG